MPTGDSGEQMLKYGWAWEPFTIRQLKYDSKEKKLAVLGMDGRTVENLLGVRITSVL